ncbi:MAG: proline--tRNA ligase [Microgenomates group bacterium]
MAQKNLLPKKTDDISKWYLTLIDLAKLADYGPAKGTMIIRPYGYSIWENIQKAIDNEIKKEGIPNAYFPLFIPNSLFAKEKEHVAGFAPETAVVTHGGGEELKDPLIVRPTSEMIMYEAYARWISSWRDLPMIMNQWNNVVRWEKRTYPFLRTSEFLWQEGHGAHATFEENYARAKWGIETYASIYRDFLAVDGVMGTKSESEKFAGADTTFTFESIMPDGKALQSCTSHDLGQNFSKTLGITFQDKEGKTEHVWQNSWGFSTRSVGGMILVHGDDNGLKLPPKIAPVKVVIIPVLGKKDTEILKYCEKIKTEIKNSISEFSGYVDINADTEKSFGWRINDAEVQGIPLRIEIGLREVEEKTITMSFRMPEMQKKLVRFEDVASSVEDSLKQIQAEMYKASQESLKAMTHDVNDYDEFKQTMKTTRGFIKAFWCEDKNCETKIKDETKASTRCKPLDAIEESGQCIYCKKDAKYKWYFAQAY